MKKIIEGTDTCCIHGEYKWRGCYTTERGWFGKIVEHMDNCAGIIQTSDNEVTIETVCPKCNRANQIIRKIEP